MSGFSMGPGLKNGGIRLKSKWSPWNFTGVWVCQAFQTWRRAWTYSRIRGAGADQFIPKRRTMWPRTWLPSPSVKRPPDIACKIPSRCRRHPWGLRANARAMEVRRSTFWVCSAAMARGRKGLWLVSDELYVSNPIRSARLADAAICCGLRPSNLEPTFTCAAPLYAVGVLTRAAPGAAYVSMQWG